MCESIREQLAWYVAGTLSRAAEREVAEHLATCSACRAEAAGWSAVAAAVRVRASERRSALPTYRALAATERPRATSTLGAITAFGRSGRDGVRWWAPRLAASLALVAGLSGLALLAARAPDQMAQQPDRDQAVVAELDAPAAVRRLTTPVRRRDARPGRADRPVTGTVVDPGDTRSSAGTAHDTSSAVIARAPAPSPWSATPSGDGAPAATAPAAASNTTPERPEPTERAQPTAPPGAPSDTALPPEITATPESPTATPEARVPTPTALPATAVPAIAGAVYDGNGATLAGAQVFAEPAGGGTELVAETDALGRYALAATTGSWLVHVEASGHALMWRLGKPTPLDADAVDITSAGAVDFYLEPAATWAIRGTVVDASGSPVARALILAAAPDRAHGGARRPSVAAYTDADGNYVLPVPTGAWLVATTLDWRGGALSWWGGDGSLGTADAVPVGDGAPSDGIDLTLQP